jgi:hypothetical protein
MEIADLRDADVRQVVLAPSRTAANHMGRARMLLTCGDYTDKRNKMSQVFEWLSHAAGPTDNTPLQTLTRFASIREGLPLEDAERYQIELSQNPRKQGQWRYTLKIGKSVVRAERHLPYGDGCTFAHFQDCNLLQGVRQALHYKRSNLASFFSSFRDTRLSWLELNRQRGQVPAPETDIAEKFGKLAISLMHLQVVTRTSNQGRPFKPAIVIHARERYEFKIGVRTAHSGTFPPAQEDKLKQFVGVAAASVEVELAYQLHMGAVPYNDGGKPDPGQLDTLVYGTNPILDVLMCDAAARTLPIVAAHKKLMSAQEIELLDQRIGTITFGGASLDKLWEDQPQHPRPEQEIELRTDGNWLARPGHPAARPYEPLPHITTLYIPRISYRMILAPRMPIHGVPPGSYMPWRVPFLNNRPLGYLSGTPLLSSANAPSNTPNAAPRPADTLAGRPPGAEAESWFGQGVDAAARHDPGFPQSLA